METEINGGKKEVNECLRLFFISVVVAIEGREVCDWDEDGQIFYWQFTNGSPAKYVSSFNDAYSDPIKLATIVGKVRVIVSMAQLQIVCFQKMLTSQTWKHRIIVAACK
jgi:hypothetical protein